jgi:hypothetical protein
MSTMAMVRTTHANADPAAAPSIPKVGASVRINARLAAKVKAPSHTLSRSRPVTSSTSPAWPAIAFTRSPAARIITTGKPVVKAVPNAPRSSGPAATVALSATSVDQKVKRVEWLTACCRRSRSRPASASAKPRPATNWTAKLMNPASASVRVAAK